MYQVIKRNSNLANMCGPLDYTAAYLYVHAQQIIANYKSEKMIGT